MNTNIVTLGVISSLCLANIQLGHSMPEKSTFCTHSCALQQALAMLTDNQALEQIKMQAYQSLTLHERHSVMPDNYFTQTAQNRAIYAKLASAIITLAHQQSLFTLANEQEYTLLKTLYTRQLIALREARLSLKLHSVTNLLSDQEKQALQKHEYMVDNQRAYTILERLAERVYTEIIVPTTADKEFYIGQEFCTTYKQAYKVAFVEEKIKELERAYQR